MEVVDSVTTVLEPFRVANETLPIIAASLVKRLRTTSFLAFGLQIALEAAQKRTQVLEADLEERNDVAHRVSRLFQSLNNMYEKLKIDCAGLEENVKSLTAEKLAITIERERLQEDKVATSKHLEQQKATITLFRQFYRRCRRFSEELREKVKGLEGLVETLRADVLSTKTSNEALQQENATFKADVLSRETSNGILQQENDTLAAQLGQRTRTGVVNFKLFQSFRKGHAEKVEECAALKSSIRRRDEAIKDLTGAYENV